VGGQFAKMKLDMKAESGVEIPGKHITIQNMAKEVLIQRIKSKLILAVRITDSLRLKCL
jgi:hypothetical protein